jgi:prepilin-type N-terminal cleavage/methylation domain-containing protein
LKTFFSGNGDKGFTLIELAIAMVIIGLLAGGGVSIMGSLTKRKARNETIDYLNQTKAALINYADINGTLPWADTNGNGGENAGSASGTLPYLDLKIRPADPHRRVIKYALNSSLGTNRSATCSALRGGLTGAPEVVDSDGSTVSFAVAAIVVSAGPMDADADGSAFDDIATGTHLGDNTDGTPNYIRHSPVAAFDDLVLYIGENELFGWLCEYLVLAVNNNSSSTVYVYNRTQATDLGSIAAGSSNTYDIISGTQIEIWNSAGGVGAMVDSTPPIPIMLAGNGLTINVP